MHYMAISRNAVATVVIIASILFLINIGDCSCFAASVSTPRKWHPDASWPRWQRDHQHDRITRDLGTVEGSRMVRRHDQRLYLLLSDICYLQLLANIPRSHACYFELGSGGDCCRPSLQRDVLLCLRTEGDKDPGIEL